MQIASSSAIVGTVTDGCTLTAMHFSPGQCIRSSSDCLCSRAAHCLGKEGGSLHHLTCKHADAICCNCAYMLSCMLCGQADANWSYQIRTAVLKPHV